MQCPDCRAEVRDGERYCRFCGAPLTGPELDAFLNREEAPPDSGYRPLPPGGVSAGPAPTVPEPRLPPGRYAPPARRSDVPGERTALVSLICSAAGLLICPCTLPLGAILGYMAMQELPADASDAARLQARFGFWLGCIPTVLFLFVAFVFVVLILTSSVPVS